MYVYIYGLYLLTLVLPPAKAHWMTRLHNDWAAAVLPVIQQHLYVLHFHCQCVAIGVAYL